VAVHEPISDIRRRLIARTMSGQYAEISSISYLLHEENQFGHGAIFFSGLDFAFNL
jgi:hypothetical protein